MKRRGLILATAGCVCLTGLVLKWSGWLGGRPGPSRSSLPVAHARAMQPFLTEAGHRYRTCQPTHWRNVMLQH